VIASVLLPVALLLPLAPVAEHETLARLTAGARVTAVTPLGERRATLEAWGGEACLSRITLRLDDGRTRAPEVDWSDAALDFAAGSAGSTLTMSASFGGEAGGIQALSLRLASDEDATDALRALRSLRLACAAVW
jgi:hypothetical protein